jgi:proteasome-associated ATPase
VDLEVAMVDPRDVETRLRELERQAASLAGQNERLTSALTAARAQLVEMRAQLEEASKPPGSYAVFDAANEDGTLDVISAGRKLRVAAAPGVEVSRLRPGQEVTLNDAMTVVGVGGYEPVGEVVTVKEVLDDARVLVVGRAEEERVVRLSGPLQDRRVRVGDALTVDTRAGYTFELVPRSEVEELVLEEIPDVAYADIGGLGSQI